MQKRAKGRAKPSRLAARRASDKRRRSRRDERLRSRFRGQTLATAQYRQYRLETRTSASFQSQITM